MKKVLLVFGSLERSGAQLRMLEVCHALRQRYPIHFDFCVLGLGPIHLRAEVENIGGSIHFVSMRSPRFITMFSNLLRSGQYEIVSSFPKLLSGIIVWLAAKHGVPTRVVNFRNSLGEGLTTNSSLPQLLPAQRLFAWLMRVLIKRGATHVVAVSHAALESMFPPPWQSTCDCQVIYSGIELAAYQGPVEHCAVREEFGWPCDSRLIINVARLAPQKNHKALLEAILLAYEKYRSIRLLLVGEGKRHAEIVDLIAHYGLSKICALAGLRTDVPRLLLASDVFFFPSLWEGLPGAPLEALAAGLPVVASNISPMQEIACHFPSTILMAPPNDVNKHAEHVLCALNMPTDRRTVQADFARTPFAMENSIKAYRALYGVD